MSNDKKTRNDKAWELLFEKYDILRVINSQGTFEISSSQINEFRESRLMAKFDHHINLPRIFRDNELSLLPISRSRYVIGTFQTHCKVSYNNDIEPVPVEFPHLESIDYTNLYSEDAALNCAFNVGIINDLCGEQVSYTVSGRMSTNIFDFYVDHTSNEGQYSIQVKNSQCEIDAGFESDSYFLIVEAKNYSVDDFIIRQLYYPYRLWSNRISKKVIPILMTYSNDIFSFFIYKFQNTLSYNSLVLVEQKNYVIAPEEIQLSDVSSVFDKISLVDEPQGIPFPQADKFERVVDLLVLLLERELTKEEITENYQFDIRQTNYYTDAGRYLGLIEKFRSGEDIVFCLTDEGKTLLKKRHKLKYLSLIEKILRYKIFYNVFEVTIANGEIPARGYIFNIMSQGELSINDTTIRRRTNTVRNWIEWIWSQID